MNSAQRVGHPDNPQYLFSAKIDFLGLGGLTFILFPVLLLLPVDPWEATLSTLFLWLANVVNHPHFAHSYQIFYADFRAKAFGDTLPLPLKIRYQISGIFIPALLFIWFFGVLLWGNQQALGYMANLMAFLVGWHYVKQGYGMLMVDAFLKKRFFTEQEKKAFLYNAYAVWILAWIVINQYLEANTRFSVQYYSFALPEWMRFVALFTTIFTSFFAGLALFSAYKRHGNRLPWNGVMAYSVSLYLWLLFVRMGPLWLVVTPLLHSLQYMLVVYRYESNKQQANAKTAAKNTRFFFWTDPVKAGIARFFLAGFIWGAVGFWLIPFTAEMVVTFDGPEFGTGTFFFFTWMLINTHHYFMDNVIWRKENTLTSQYLFMPRDNS